MSSKNLVHVSLQNNWQEDGACNRVGGTYTLAHGGGYKREIRNKIEWAEEGIGSLILFNNKNKVKIQLKLLPLSIKATRKGLPAHKRCVSEFNIKQKDFIQIKTCMKC